MLKVVSVAIPFFFNLLFFFVPLVVYPYSYELFEFSKVVLTYALTLIICAFWVAKMILARKIIFRRTIFDLPLLLFLLSQLVSTLFSIDLRTSLLGYYTRFHGGLLSTLAYSSLFWAFVSNMDREKTLKALKLLLLSGVLVSIYAILQHFGIDEEVWVQDVQARVFSTLGQPNWLAAWLVALLPLSWFFAKFHSEKGKKVLFTFVTALFTLALSYTKSRSGLLALFAALASFTSLNFFLVFNKKPPARVIKNYLILVFLTLAVVFIGGTPWSKPLEQMISQRVETQAIETPALEGGGTESGTIRRIVWKGAFEIWKRYPLFGSGVETFAYSFYPVRPLEHNLVSEWDFLYNKAHNEFLNVLATTGILGFTSYLYLIYVTFSFLVKKLLERKEAIFASFFSGLLGLSLSNFLGFSVVPTALIFFLFPAMAVAMSEKIQYESLKRPDVKEKLFLLATFIALFYLLLLLARYWTADKMFADGKGFNDAGDPVNGREKLVKALNLSPREAIFWDEISQSDALIAEALAESDKVKAQEFANVAVIASDKAVSLSPRNVNLLRSRAYLFIKLSSLDTKYLERARDTLIEATKMAPTDAKLFYNLALTYARLGDLSSALSLFEKSVAMKTNYKDARLGYALILIDLGERERAKEELTFILEKIDPQDAIVRQTLEEIK